MKNLFTFLFLGLFLFSVTLPAQKSSDDLAMKIEAMAKVGACYSPAFSPDGNEIAFISNMSGSPQIWKMPAEGGWPIQLTNFNDPVSGLSWAPNKNTLAFQMAPGGGMNSQVYLLSANGTDLKMITSGGKTNNWLGEWSKDGNFLTYASNQLNPAGMDCHLYNLKNNTSKLIVKNKGIGSVTDISVNNKQFLINRLENRGSNDLFLVSNTGRENLLTKHTGPGNFYGKFSSTGNIYMASDLDRDLVAFGTIGIGEFKILSERDDATLENFFISHDASRVLLIWNVSGKHEISLFDLHREKELFYLDFPIELVNGAEFSKDDRYFLFTGTGATEPTNIWTLDFENGNFNKLTESPHPGIRLQELVTPELVKFKSFDDLELSGWLYKPKTGSQPFPTVISYHGGPEGQSRPFFSYAFQALLSQGIAVFSPNVRGSSGFGKHFVNLDNGALRANGVKDIKACYDFIVNSGFSDPNKIAIMGGSYGGYMVMAGITEYPDLFAAAANLFGVVNFKTFFEQTEPWMAAISKVEYGDPDTQAEMLKKLSPIHKVGLVKTPTIVLHGANDTNVPVVEAEQVVNNLKKRKIPVEYILFEDEGHGWRKTPNKVKSTISIVNWFKKHLEVK